MNKILVCLVVALSIVVAQSQLCVNYCNSIANSCTSLLDMGFQDNGTCVEACELIPQGTPGATSGNSANCRLYWATQASPDCDAASVSGGGICGSYCDTYCFYLQQTCFTEFQNPTTGAWDNSFCETLCQFGIKDTGTDYPIDELYDSIQCRIYHAAASWVNETVHCPHASIGGAARCGEPITAYCYFMNYACPTTYGTYNNCLTQAATINQTGFELQFGPSYGDNLGCRLWQAKLSYYEKSSCENAGLVSSICNNDNIPTPAPPPTYNFNTSPANAVQVFGFAVFALICFVLGF